jgi:tetratricopeptide (TPR) repeat protein
MVRSWTGLREKQVPELLSRGDFTTLEHKLEAVQRAYEAGAASEYFVFTAFEMFEKPELQPAIERWAKAHPHSWQGLAARGMMRWALAAQARGSKLSPETQAQLDRTKSFLDLASNDFRNVLVKRPRFLPAYGFQIDKARMLGDSNAGRAAIEAALRTDPNSYFVRRGYMTGLSPQWGGTFASMDDFAREAQAHADANPELIALLGETSLARAYDHGAAGDWRGAVGWYTEALRFARKPSWLERRATSYKELGNWSGAIADLNEAIHYDPDFAEGLADRAFCELQTQQRDAALQDFARASELAPDVSWIALEYARAMVNSFRLQDAAFFLERFLTTHPRDADALEELGLLYSDNLHQPDRARDLMERLIKIDPKRATAWRIYGDALFVLHDPRTRTAYEHYFELVDPEDPTEKRLGNLIRQRLSYLPPAAIPQ